MCTAPGAPQGEVLYFRLRGLLASHLELCFAAKHDIYTKVVSRTDGGMFVKQEISSISGDTEFLEHYCTQFNAFVTGTSYTSELFRYLVGCIQLIQSDIEKWYNMQNRFWIKYSHSETGRAPIPGVYTIDEVLKTEL